ncbi:MAG: hypothetical protein PHF74_02290 [Dehalococcoidales bacterium]|nr:hypothetical protein [Dehalococcoidales bacterium]
MSAKKKHGKGKYAYQAKKAGGQIEKPSTDFKAVVSDLVKPDKETGSTAKEDNHVIQAKNNVAVMPVNIGKIDLMYEIKRIAVIASFIIVLLVILFIVLK